MILIAIFIFPAALILTWIGIRFFHIWSLKKGVLDIPNERSSHDSPTPRGGGLVIVLVTLIFYGLISYLYPGTFSWGFLVGAVLIATVSWLDDRYSVSTVWRLMMHALAAVLLIADRGYWNEISLFSSTGAINLSIAGPILTFLWIVWLINSYNFMDGIDGIAGIQAVVAGFAWLGLSWLSGIPDVALFGGVILFSSLGFLLHNWPPARIFMGDVGSAFLGFTFASMPFIAARPDPLKPVAFLPLAAIVFVWFFLFDSIVTFMRRAFRHERVWVAHREHLYQRLVSSGLSHGFVSLLYGSMTIIISSSVLFAYAFSYRFDVTVIPIVLVVTTVFIFFCAKRDVLT